MENLNAEQVMKKLEQLSLEDCMTGVRIKGHSVVHLLRDALALINSQEQRIKELTVELDAMRGAANSYKMYSKTLEGENEKLKNLVDKCFDTENALNEKVKELTEENERWKNAALYFKNRYEFRKKYGKVRADTVNRDQIAKEMLEDTE